MRTTRAGVVIGVQIAREVGIPDGDTRLTPWFVGC